MDARYNPGVQSNSPTNPTLQGLYNTPEEELLQTDIRSMLEKQVIEETMSKEQGFISTLILMPRTGAKGE